MEQESFEIQTKVRITDSEPVLAALHSPEIEIVRQRHYREYDTYFSFSDPGQGYLRFREDHFIGEDGEVNNVRARLTLIGAPEFNFPKQQVLLSRSSYYAPANQSLRFYREYFKPAGELELEKDRLRYLVRYQDTEFFINIDTFQKPALGQFLEIKSRTWSRKDANHKAALAKELLSFLCASPLETISKDYIEMVVA
jgi:5-methylthioadenosine/S-adenosylhomocysteine deaminase